MFETDLTKRGSVTSMIETYACEMDRIRAAYAELEKARQTLEATFGKKYIYTFPDRSYMDTERALDEVQRKIKVTAWHGIVDLLDIQKRMSAKRLQDFQKRLDDPEAMPELTVQNAFEILETLAENAQTFTQEAIEEAYDFLRPRSFPNVAEYKTNQKNAREHIGPKVIIQGMIHHSYGGQPTVAHWNEPRLINVDKAFHALDGKSFEGYRSPIVDAINTAPDGKGQTEYFRFKAYGNGNLHLEFRRLDLLEKFNAAAGGMNLRSGTL